jgi:hypothetical protein
LRCAYAKGFAAREDIEGMKHEETVTDGTLAGSFREKTINSLISLNCRGDGV